MAAVRERRARLRSQRPDLAMRLTEEEIAFFKEFGAALLYRPIGFFKAWHCTRCA